jgi:hypothetical protein
MMSIPYPTSYKSAVSEKQRLIKNGIKCHVIKSKVFNLDYLEDRTEPQWIQIHMVQLL